MTSVLKQEEQAVNNLTQKLQNIGQQLQQQITLLQNQCKADEMMEKEHFMVELGNEYDRRLTQFTNSIRSGGNILANYATTGASSTLSGAVNHVMNAVWTFGF